MKENLIIIGSSGHAKVVIDIIEKGDVFTLVGLIDSFKKKDEIFCGYKILGDIADIPQLVNKYKISGCIIAIGDNWLRSVVRNKVVEIMPEIRFISAVHPTAIIAHNVNIGTGSVISAGAVIGCETAIGDFCIVNTNASIDHDCIMNDYSSLAPGVTTGGNVNIGKYTAISLGANIIHGVSVSEHTVIGAGATVLTDIGDRVVAYGTPARVVRSRACGEKYL